MATHVLTLGTVVSNTGWTTPSNIGASDNVYATCTAAGSVFVAETANTPADYGATGATLVFSVEWSLSGTATRTKAILVELVSTDATPVIHASYSTPAVTAQASDTTNTSGSISVAGLTKAQIDAARLRVTMQEGGGMADTVVVRLDHITATVTYTPAAAGVDASFAATVPIQALAAGVSVAGPSPTAGFTFTSEEAAAGSVTFAATIPVQTLAAAVANDPPGVDGSFAASVPMQTLTAAVGVEAPEAGASFVASVPMQSLSAAVSHDAPEFTASFAASVPNQALSAAVTYTAPGSNIGFSAAVPPQSLAAAVSHTAPEDTASFAATVPVQSMSAAVSVVGPGMNVGFAASIPLQSLAATLDRTIPEREAAFAAAISMQQLAAAIIGTAPGFSATFAATVPVQSLAAGVSSTLPGVDLGFAATVPRVTLLAAVEYAAPVAAASRHLYAARIGQRPKPTTVDPELEDLPGFTGGGHIKATRVGPR